jgi:hypothetical protein
MKFASSCARGLEKNLYLVTVIEPFSRLDNTTGTNTYSFDTDAGSSKDSRGPVSFEIVQAESRAEYDHFFFFKYNFLPVPSVVGTVFY